MVITDNLIKYFPDHTKGLGDIIAILSVLVNTNLKIEIHMAHFDHRWYALKDIYNIPDSKLQIIVIGDLNYQPSFISNVLNKFNIKAPYIDVNEINLFGQLFDVGDYSHKGAIGIVKHNGSYFNSNDIDFNSFPGCRYYPDSVWNQINQMISKSGRDIIELSSNSTGLVNKTFIVNNCVDAIISCDNGVAHLAHTLKVPVIMLPWQNNRISAQRYHIDKKTYFLDSPDELLSWSIPEFDNKIHSLQENLGNNIFISTDQNLEPSEIMMIERFYSRLT